MNSNRFNKWTLGLAAVGAVPIKGSREADWRPVANIRDKKGGDMSEWPADLRIREFPQ
jgi:hypothetical protein